MKKIYTYNRKKNLLLLTFLLLLSYSYGQTFTISSTNQFNKRVINLYKDSNNDSLIIYKTNLRLNTDGAPKSYHPGDLKADSKAYNLIINAVAIYRKSDSFCISIPNKDIDDYSPKYRKCKKKPSDFSNIEKKEMVRSSYMIFEQFIKDSYRQPTDYEIIWNSVLVEDNGKPCIFKNGENKDYYASQTAVNNGPVVDRGECDCNFYLDASKIPAMVLPKSVKKMDKETNKLVEINALIKFGAKKEDLVIAYNPITKIIAYAIIGDTGPSDNLGEGNILMNSKLKDKKTYPTNRKDINNALVISNEVIITIVPNSGSLITKPYTEEKITNSCKKWMESVGFRNEENFITFIKALK